jgi:hypothetical protein
MKVTDDIKNRSAAPVGFSAWRRASEQAEASLRKRHLRETGLMTLAFLGCVILAAIVSTMMHPPVGAAAPVTDWTANGLSSER